MTKPQAIGLLPAATVALFATIAYFVLTGGWSRLATPVPGLVAIGAGLIGFGVGEIARAILGRRPTR
jgi:hypothetical protein